MSELGIQACHVYILHSDAEIYMYTDEETRTHAYRRHTGLTPEHNFRKVHQNRFIIEKVGRARLITHRKRLNICLIITCENIGK